jgi:hypothetical protein
LLGTEPRREEAYKRRVVAAEFRKTKEGADMRPVRRDTRHGTQVK